MQQLKTELELFRSIRQQNGRQLTLKDLELEVKNKKMPGIKLFEHLYRNQHLIPNEWDAPEIYFLNTAHSDGDCGPSIFCLFKGRDGRWHKKLCFLDHVLYFDYKKPLVVFKSRIYSKITVNQKRLIAT